MRARESTSLAALAGAALAAAVTAIVPGAAPASPVAPPVQPSPGLPIGAPPPPAISGLSAGRPSVAGNDESGVSSVIFPPQRIPLAFSHVQHLELPGEPLACADCHDRALTSRSSIDDLIPRERACRRCHAIDRSVARSVARKPARAGSAPAPDAVGMRASGACATCHPGWKPGQPSVARIAIPIPNIKFDHASHAARGTPCVACHGDLRGERVGLATRAQLPRMRLCLTCHDGRRAPDACVTCHLAAPGGRVRTSYAGGQLVPSGSLRGAAHDATFRTNHALVAKNDPRFCDNCHVREYCADCHSGRVKPMDFHAGDYITSHTVDARRNRPDCSACHRLQTFCVGCHARSGVVPDGRGSEFDSTDPARRFHPQGWADDIPGPNHHGFQAQRNIAQCASCHREQFCTGCHSAQPGARRINPHPRGWAMSRQCRALLSRNARVCLRCHVNTTELTCEPFPP